MIDDALAEYDAGLTLDASLADVSRACLDVAKDMGMVALENGGCCIRFREPFFGVRSHFRTGVSVSLSNDGGSVRGYVLGSSKGASVAAQREHVKKTVQVVVRRLQSEFSVSASDGVALCNRRRHRSALRTRRVLGWVPAILLVPSTVLAGEYLRRPWSFLIAIAWLWLAIALAGSCELIRKHLIGTDSRADYGLLVAITAVVIP